ncbi:MAG TPA: MlaD family protein [Solirubrobacteraceae bacterium]|nr:MlaD family protein [Solirubrobacteraceae bacterium]
MRRLLVIAVLLVAGAAAVATASAGSDDPQGPRYSLELDNAFGIVEGADVKVSGVRAGRVTGMRVDRSSKRALIDFRIDKAGFGSLRTDAFCETRPQSLIGEYFIDCRPGTAPQRLRTGATIPVEQSASTIPVDLINNIMRRPYRERLGIILDELGAGVGGRAEDIQATLRRAVPALRETDRVLAILAEQNDVLADLTKNADTVIGDLAANRKDVGRWVTETKETASASAERRAEIGASLRRLPGFLRELEPTMAKLGAAADAQSPALEDLNASAGQLARLLENLPEFSDASRTSLTSLAEMSRKGRPALRAAKPTIAELERFAAKTPELANNLDLVLRDLDDRKRAVEPDPRSPGGKGYTGLEALLQYVFDQSMAINAFDSNGYMLKVNLFLSECSEYQNRFSLKEKLKEDPGFYARCAAILGPNQPGITQNDPTYTGAQDHGGHHLPSAKGKQDKPEPPAPEAPRTPESRDGKPKLDEDVRRQAEKIAKQLEDTLGIDLPDLPATPALPALPPTPALPQAPVGTANAQQLLDYLLAP